MKMNFIAAMRHFFGYLPSQTLQQFSAEIKQLTDTDRAAFKEMLASVGYQVTVN